MSRADSLPAVALFAAAAAGAVTPGIANAPAPCRTIDEIIIHCSATPAGRIVTADEIRRWHRARGFTDIGYHYIVGLDGTVTPGRGEDKIGAHCLGHNARSIGVCYIGGCDTDMRPADTRTPAQRAALDSLIAWLLRRYPGAVVRSHRDFAAKACPSFDATAEYARRFSDTNSSRQ